MNSRKRHFAITRARLHRLTYWINEASLGYPEYCSIMVPLRSDRPNGDARFRAQSDS